MLWMRELILRPLAAGAVDFGASFWRPHKEKQDLLFPSYWLGSASIRAFTVTL
jgi:hypothetical protein